MRIWSRLRTYGQASLVMAAFALSVTLSGCTRESGPGTAETLGTDGTSAPAEEPEIPPFPGTSADGSGSSPGKPMEGADGEGTEHGTGDGSDAEPDDGSESGRETDGTHGHDASEDDRDPDEDDEDAVEYQWIENIIIATDIHYLSPSLQDGGERFREMELYGEGQIISYIDQVTDAFLEEVISLRPNALILSGDLTLNGEKQSHEELAEKLYQVEEAGVPVLVIPGNHDINNKQAARYVGRQRQPTEYTTPEEFREIYRDFGYDEAISEDARSLSYVYQLDENTRFLMLDTCQYRPVAKVGGAILSPTYDWIEDQLEWAWADDVDVIPVAHHNLLEESQVYVDNCTIEHSEQLVEILEAWDVNIFLSGHLHVQHHMRSDGKWGIWELVTSSLATPVCQYGVLDYRDDQSFTYKTWTVDVEGWAKRHGVTTPELLEFNKFKGPFLRKIFYNQSMGALDAFYGISKEEKEQMSQLYAELNYYYYQGTAYQIRDQVEKDPAYALWMEKGVLSVLGDYVMYIMDDAVQDYNFAQED